MFKYFKKRIEISKKERHHWKISQIYLKKKILEIKYSKQKLIEFIQNAEEREKIKIREYETQSKIKMKVYI